MDGIQLAKKLIQREREQKTGFLDLGNLGLSELPRELADLEDLRTLNLGAYFLSSDGQWSESENGLERNSIAELPEWIEELTGLRSLAFSHTPVTDLAPLAGLPQLQSLLCYHTQVSDLAPLADLPQLQSLQCSHTQVTDLAPLAGLPQLQSLQCSHTQVSDLAPLAGLPQLQSLSCSYTRVNDLAPLADRPQLQSLQCSGTQITDLAPLASLPQLQSLQCYHTQVSDLAPLAGLPRLHSLDCSHTQVNDLAPLASLPQLQSLQCYHTQVSDLAPLASLPQLQSLQCYHTQVSDLAPLADRPQLQSLDCSRTQVTDLAPLADRPQLQSLQCSHTQVSDLAPLAGLPQLQSLDCSHTQVTDLAPLASLPQLQSLSCSYTRVNDLAPLAGLPRLHSLDCSHTQVTDLAPLAALRSLEEIHANRCHLDDLPRDLVLSEVLNRLSLVDARVPGMPAEILAGESWPHGCLHTLRDHLQDLEAGVERVRDVKVVVLGNGRVGKTQICRRLREMPFDDTVPSTHGITIATQPWGTEPDDSLLNLWDFGGQDIYHGTHALFMSSRAVFLTVWHPDFERNEEVDHAGTRYRNYALPYWIAYVRHLGGSQSPVVVVQSQCDRAEQETAKPPADDLEFTFVKSCCFSAKNDRGIAGLREAIQQGIEYLRQSEGVASIGKGRAAVIRRLQEWREADAARPTTEEREHRTLTKTEFRRLCEDAGGIHSPDSLLSYLHDVGVVFYRDTLFSKRIILDQTWALDAIYAVFDRQFSYQQLLQQRGRFTRSLMQLMVWQEYSLDEQKLFLSLMESCGVCFVHRRADEKHDIEAEYIAPDLLPEKEKVLPGLSGRWSVDAATVTVEYCYPFLHQGLIRTVISHIGGLAGDAAEYWKYGAWFYDARSGGKAVVEQEMLDERQGLIRIQVQDDHSGTLLHWIRECIEQQSRTTGCVEPRILANGEEVGELRTEPREAPDAMSLPPSEDLEPSDRATERRVRDEPRFAHAPTNGRRRIYMSYSWGDDSSEGQQRQNAVDAFCDSMSERGIEIVRDKTEMEVGDRISKFMNAIAQGDVVIAVISDRYLKSDYCMYELFQTYRNCADNPDKFLDKVVPLILPDAKLHPVTARLDYALYWKAQKEELQAQVEALGIEYLDETTVTSYRRIRDFANKVAEILHLLSDKLMPRDFDAMMTDGFAEILPVLGLDAG